MVPIDHIIDREFPTEMKTPTMEKLAEIRTKLLKELPVDTSVELSFWMNIVTLTVRANGQIYTRNAKATA